MLGIYPLPNLYHGEFYLAAHYVTAKINIGKRVYINNNATIIADKTTIFIYDTPLIDPNFIYFDSTFHSLYPAKRLSSDYRCKPVTIVRNVFISAGAVISNNVPTNVIVKMGIELEFNTLKDY